MGNGRAKRTPGLAADSWRGFALGEHKRGAAAIRDEVEVIV